MKHFSAIILVSFVSIAIFGAFDAHAGMETHETKCITAITQGIDCPKLASPIENLSLHLETYKDFSLATLSASALSILALAFAILFASFIFLFKHFFRPPALSISNSPELQLNSPQIQRIHRWLSLHENSPSVS